MSVLSVIFYGPLRVYIDPYALRVAYVLDSDGADAQGHYRPAHLAAARSFALSQCEALAD